MDWLAKFLEEVIAANAYLFWKRYFQQENSDEDSENKNPDEACDD